MAGGWHRTTVMRFCPRKSTRRSGAIERTGAGGDTIGPNPVLCDNSIDAATRPRGSKNSAGCQVADGMSLRLCPLGPSPRRSRCPGPGAVFFMVIVDKFLHRCPELPRAVQHHAASRDLIRRMAAENCLWGAPRIHGELLKLEIVISERTVSRYLRHRPTTRSQTWWTFFANHFGGQAFSPVRFADANDEAIAVDASDVSFRPAPSIDAPRASIHGPNFDWGRSLLVLRRASRPTSPSGPYTSATKRRP